MEMVKIDINKVNKDKIEKELLKKSIKDKNKSKYSAMRNWLSQRQLSMGDYIIEKWDDEFSVKLDGVLTE